MSTNSLNIQIRDIFESLDSFDVGLKSYDPPDVRSHKHDIEKLRTQHSHNMEKTILYFTLTIVSSVLLFCFLSVFFGDLEIRRFSFSCITYIITAVFSFAVGRGVSIKSKHV